MCLGNWRRWMCDRRCRRLPLQKLRTLGRAVGVSCQRTLSRKSPQLVHDKRLMSCTVEDCHSAQIAQQDGLQFVPRAGIEINEHIKGEHTAYLKKQFVAVLFREWGGAFVIDRHLFLGHCDNLAIESEILRLTTIEHTIHIRKFAQTHLRWVLGWGNPLVEKTVAFEDFERLAF